MVDLGGNYKNTVWKGFGAYVFNTRRDSDHSKYWDKSRAVQR